MKIYKTYNKINQSQIVCSTFYTYSCISLKLLIKYNFYVITFSSLLSYLQHFFLYLLALKIVVFHSKYTCNNDIVLEIQCHHDERRISFYMFFCTFYETLVYNVYRIQNRDLTLYRKIFLYEKKSIIFFSCISHNNHYLLLTM